jgi:hypothetical protein
MGLIFHEQGQLESALAMLDKVADTWYKYLSKETPKKNGDGDDDEDGAHASASAALMSARGHAAAGAASATSTAAAAAAATAANAAASTGSLLLSKRETKKPAITLSALSAELSQEVNTAENVGNAAELEELKVITWNK